MEFNLVLKAISDETRMKIIKLLLSHNYCVRGLARMLELSEAAISQHLKILREAGLLTCEKQGYFVHYTVKRNILVELAGELESLATMEQVTCSEQKGSCRKSESDIGRVGTIKSDHGKNKYEGIRCYKEQNCHCREI
jgi:ArsR family transcriptional regulator